MKMAAKPRIHVRLMSQELTVPMPYGDDDEISDLLMQLLEKVDGNLELSVT